MPLLSLLGPVGQRKPQWDSKRSHTQCFASKLHVPHLSRAENSNSPMSGPVCQGLLGSDLARRGEFVGAASPKAPSCVRVSDPYGGLKTPPGLSLVWHLPGCCVRRGGIYHGWAFGAAARAAGRCCAKRRGFHGLRLLVSTQDPPSATKLFSGAVPC